MPQLLIIEWEESERGWGVRPDGYSVHTSPEAGEKYVKDYWERQPDEVPDEYSRPCRSRRFVEVPADSPLVKLATESGGSLRVWQHESDLVGQIRAASKR